MSFVINIPGRLFVSGEAPPHTVEGVPRWAASRESRQGRPHLWLQHPPQTPRAALGPEAKLGGVSGLRVPLKTPLFPGA